MTEPQPTDEQIAAKWERRCRAAEDRAQRRCVSRAEIRVDAQEIRGLLAALRDARALAQQWHDTASFYARQFNGSEAEVARLTGIVQAVETLRLRWDDEAHRAALNERRTKARIMRACEETLRAVLGDRRDKDNACTDCGIDNPVWFAPNELWNRVMGDHTGFLCPRCFIVRAEAAGVRPTAWVLTEERAALTGGTDV